MAVFTEFYADARNEAIVGGLEGAEYLNDDCLFSIADRKMLEEAYADIEEHVKYIENNKVYPERLNPLWQESSDTVVHSVRYLRTYTVVSIIMIFFAFSFVGWGWEVTLHLVKDGVFVNRGVMHGPWLPVYGSGVSLIVVLLARWREAPY